MSSNPIGNNEKIRYLRLNQVFKKALSQSIAKFQRWDKVSSCFPEYSKTELGRVHLVNCQKQVTEFWTELCFREFQEIMKDRNVKEKLDELDTLIADAKIRLTEQHNMEEHGDNNDKLNEISVTDLSVEEIIQCNLYNQRESAVQQLDQRIAKIDEINGKLENELLALEHDINIEYKELENIYNEYFGEVTKQPMDKTLAQGLNEMVLELKEI